jgi:hypothetical protein
MKKVGLILGSRIDFKDGYIILPPNPSIMSLAKPDIYAESAVQQYPVGTKYFEGDNVYCYGYWTSAVHALGCEYPAINAAAWPTDSKASGIFTGTTPKIGDTQVYITDVGAAGDRPVNYYEGGFAHFYSNTANQRQSHRINRSTVGNGVGITVTLDHPLRSGTGTTALALTSADLLINQYRKLAHQNLVATWGGLVSVMGYPMVWAQAAYWSWVKTWGPCQGHYIATWPGETAGQRDVFFDANGGLIQIAQGTAGNQRAGYLMAYSVSNTGCVTFFLQLNR